MQAMRPNDRLGSMLLKKSVTDSERAGFYGAARNVVGICAAQSPTM